jgi:poly-gamma-glutamate capsule biosynthesis protein CapA/YwtB (metallophosphatase superfamily)
MAGAVAAVVACAVAGCAPDSGSTARPQSGQGTASPSPAGQTGSTGSASPAASGSPARHGSPLSPRWTGNGRAVTIAFGGDVHFAGPIGTRLAANPGTVFKGTLTRLLSGADISMTNFESALVRTTCPDPQPKKYVFSVRPAALTAFKSAGVTLVSEANNHGEDCGRAGMLQSLAIAKAAHYPVIGIGRNARRAFAPWRGVVNGQRISIIAATQVLDSDLAGAWTATAHQPGLASAYAERDLIASVQAARKKSDTVAVFLHWGTETKDCPNPQQAPLAHALVKAGADIVVGTHAHVQLGAGYLGSALVDYGLGNLAFYDDNPPEDYSGTLLVTVTGRHVDRFRWRPAVIQSSLPVPQHGAAARAAIRRWEGLRSCTGLAAHRGPSLATRAQETRRHGASSGTLARPDGPGSLDTRRDVPVSQRG